MEPWIYAIEVTLQKVISSSQRLNLGKQISANTIGVVVRFTLFASGRNDA